MPHKGVVLFGDGSDRKGRTCGDQVPALARVANRPIAHHVLDAMAAAGVQEVVAVGTADVLLDVRRCLSQYQRPSLRMEYAISGDGSGPGEALRAAAPLVGAAPCIVHAGDGLLDQSLDRYVDLVQQRSVDLVLLCPSPTRDRVKGFSVHDGLAPTIPSMLCEAGIGMFGPGAFRQACQTGAEANSSGLGTLAHRLSGDGRQVEVQIAEGWRQYRGNPHDLLEVNRLALDLLGPQLCRTHGEQNRIEGRVQIDPTASVRRSVIVGPVVVGAGAEISNAYLGPYTSIGPQARIEGAEIERSIISAGARVMHVGDRLVSSLVGPAAHVFRDFSLPRAMRLRVGEGDEVALC
jgi:glucose-1-phosphate thymidylyltransferase